MKTASIDQIIAVEDKMREMLEDVKSGKKSMVVNRLTTLPLPEAAVISFREDSYLFDPNPRQIEGRETYVAINQNPSETEAMMVLMSKEVYDFLIPV